VTRSEYVDAPLQIALFGPFDARCEGATIRPLRTRKGQWLLALLALRQGREVDRMWLAGLLWPESQESQALYSLRRSLTDLRNALDSQEGRIVAPAARSLCLERAGVRVDVIDFDAAVTKGDRESLLRAVTLYRGPLLEGCTEEWVFQERAPREQAYLQALESLARHALENNEPQQAIIYLERALTLDRLQESATRLLMRAQAQSGNYAATVLIYRELRLKLRQELNSEPDPETVALYKRLRADARTRLAAPEPAARPSLPRPIPPSARLSIPRSATSLIGREEELEEIAALLEAARVVTLTGIGGVGKTRLSLAVAEAVVENYADGACMVELADVQNGRDVPAAVALTLGLKPTGEADLQTAIFATLRPQQLLLLLDNFEQVVDAAPFISLLLQKCPQVTCLITSRQLLQIRGEHEFNVEPLPLPVPGSAPDVIQSCSSVRLFLECAAAARPGFQLTAANIEAVIEICLRLEGLPLAVELTAALLRGLTPQQVLPRLKDRFRLLASTQRDLTPRQRSLRGAIDWSYELLSPEEQCAFATLSVFAGSFTIEAAEQVCRAEDTLESLFALRDKSLLKTAETNEEMRYYMLETLREYARERRALLEDAAGLCQRHAAYYLSVGQELGAVMMRGGTEGEAASRALEIELPNLRAGMEWSVAQQDHASVIPYGVTLMRFMYLRGFYEEARLPLIVAEASARATQDLATVAGLLNRRGLIAWDRAEHSEAQALFEESYAICKSLDDRAQMLLTLPNLGMVAWIRLDYAAARRVWEEALSLAIEAEQVEQEALLRGNLGMLMTDQGDFATAERYLAVSLVLSQRENPWYWAGYTLCYFAELYRAQGCYSEALAHAEKARHQFDLLGNQIGVTWSLGQIAQIMLDSDRAEEAKPLAAEGLVIARRHGVRRSEMLLLEVLARIAGGEGDWQTAQELLMQCYALAQQTKGAKQILEVLFRYGILMIQQEKTEQAYKLLSVVAKSYPEAKLESSRLASARCAELRHVLTPEQIMRLDAVLCNMIPENAFDFI
jgi:predicted ATPase/DNA-binding SARP family transcriptional activator